MHILIRKYLVVIKRISRTLPLLFGICFLALPTMGLAQAVITGRVFSRNDHSPVADASVFISNSSIGAVTAKDGTFRLTDVKPGKYELVVSDIAFETFIQPIEIGINNTTLPDIILSAQTKKLNEVTIKYKTDPNRPQYLSWFKEQFLGTSPLATECTLLNPEVLDLSYNNDTKTLTVSSEDFLVIENKALGYRLKYLLDNFSFQRIWQSDITEEKTNYKGYVLFEPINASPNQKGRWEAARYEVYLNSPMHFLRSLQGNSLANEGFCVQKLSFIPNTARPSDSLINSRLLFFQNLKPRTPANNDSLNYWTKKLKLSKGSQKLLLDTLNGKDIAKFTGQEDQMALVCNSCDLFVRYYKKGHLKPTSHLDVIENRYNTQFTLIQFNMPDVLFYKSGALADPLSVTYKGVWGRLRVADLLPINYDPPAGIYTIQTPTERASEKLSSFVKFHPIEKAYLHFDKPYYAAGDTVYFKGYIMQGERHNPSVLSGVLYVDLINTVNKVDRSIKLQIVNGVTWGDFALPDTLPAGNYRIRACTQWMRNEGPDAFFEKTIPVGNIHPKKVAESLATKTTYNKPDIQFFPEGGELVAGIPTRIAFKAIRSNGLGIGISGNITDEAGQVVAKLGSSHAGMGNFYLTPELNKVYTAHLIFADGNKNDVQLPLAMNSGISMSVNNDSVQKATIKIAANKSYFEANKGKVYSVLIWSGEYSTTVNCRLDSAVITMDIIKRRLFTGVTRITLFSENLQPLCERLIFIQNFDQMAIDLHPDKEHYKTRDKVAIQLRAKTRADSATIGHFSVSVTDENKVKQDDVDQTTILSNLLLTSDLKGYVEQPNYYFADSVQARQKALDMVMLTHGYRHFAWKQVLDSANIAIKYPAEAGLTIQGTAENLLGKPIAKARVTLLSSQNKRFISDTADDKGRFRFSNLLFADSAKFILQAVNASGKNSTKLFYQDDLPAPKVGIVPSGQLQNDTSMSTYLDNNKKQQEINLKYLPLNSRVLKEVKIRAVKDENNYPSSSLLGPGHADQVMHADDIEKIGGQLSTSLNGRLRGVSFKGGVAVSVSGPMLLVLDGLVMPSTFSVDNVNISSVETIEVLRFASASIYGIEGGHGVLVITTKQGKGLQSKDIPSTGILPITVKGFYRAREFYAPKYEANLPINPRPDLRSTIYWNPSVITDKDGNANFEFYSADTPGTYRVVVEGIDNKGDLGRKVFFIKVE